MSLNPPLRPSGVGAYTHVEQPQEPEESYVVPVPEEEEEPEPRIGRVGLVVLVLIVIALVTTATIVVLALFVPMEYPQTINFGLDAENAWENTVCIPTGESYWGGPTSILVSFNWRASTNAQVDVLMAYTGNVLQNAIYNVTAPSGSWSYQASNGGGDTYLEFLARGAPTLPEFVNISMSYNMPGHVIGGPTVPGTCSPS